MRVADVMTVGVKSVEPDATIGETMTLIADEHISALPVVDGGRLVGVISQSDIVRGVAFAKL